MMFLGEQQIATAHVPPDLPDFPMIHSSWVLELIILKTNKKIFREFNLSWAARGRQFETN